MADYKTTLVVGADTTQAEEKLDKLKREAERLEGDTTGGAPDATPATPAAPPPPRIPPPAPSSAPAPAAAPTPAPASAPPPPPALDGTEIGRAAARELISAESIAPPQREAPQASPPAPASPPSSTPPATPPRGNVPDSRRQGDEFGRAAARQIGRAVAGFALHQAASIGFAAARTPGGNNVNVDRAESAVGGALQYGTMGAMVGGPIGAVIGGLAGAVAGLARHETELRNQIADNVIARQDTVYRANVSSTTRASDAAFSELLRGRTSEERTAMLEARRQEIRSGEGQWSIANLEASLRRREAAGDVQSHEYKTETANLEMQRQREAALTDQIIATRVESAAPEAVRIEDLTDAYSKKGLVAGGDVAAAALNEQISIGREQVELLKRIAAMGASSIYKSEAVERAATFE